MSFVDEYNELIAKKTIEGLEKRNMEGFYCPTKKDALEKALEIIKKGSSVSWGGSMSINEIGLKDAVKNGDYVVYDRDTAEDKDKTTRMSYFADYYLASSNAVTVDGKLVNIDGSGNRVSAMIYGPANVILIVGINKICFNEDEALSRVKNKAAVINAIRFGKKTPCSTIGKCADCLTDSCICCQTLVTRQSKIKGRIKVIITGESLGY